jgi:hypothetical protein
MLNPSPLTTGSRIALLAITSAALLAFPTAAQAFRPKPEASKESDAPVLLVLGVAGEDDAPAAALARELSLALDTFDVRRRQVRRGDFPEQSIAEQVSRVNRIRRRGGAAVVVWLARPLPGVLMLHVVAGGHDNAIIRTVEVQAAAGAEGTLAMAVRELLAADQILAAPSEPEVEPVPRAAQPTTRTAPPTSAAMVPALPSAPAERAPYVALLLNAEHSIQDGEGPATSFLGGIGLHRVRLFGGLKGFVSLLGRIGPWNADDAATIRAKGVRIAVGLQQVCPVADSLEVVASGGAEAERSRITVEPAVGIAREEVYWSARLTGGLEMAFSPWDGWLTGAVLNLGFRPTGVTFRRASDDAVLYRSPRWEAGLGLTLSRSL